MAGYRVMTYPAFAPLLDRVGQDPTVLAIIAEADEPAGLVLAEVGLTGAVVRSVFVAPQFRRRGIGMALLEGMEAELRRRGVMHFGGGYARNIDSGPIEGLLAKAAWEEPILRMYLFRVNLATAAPGVRKAPWFRSTSLEPGTEMIPYSEVGPDDLAAFDQIMERFNVPGGLHPTCSDEPVETDLSLVLKINQELFGWSVCHRLAPNWVRFTSTYIRPDCPVKGLGIRMLVETIRRYITRDEGNPEAIVSWGCPAHLPMAGFQLRQFVPHFPGIVVTQIWERGKHLSAG
jgi:hypothetical protein